MYPTAAPHSHLPQQQPRHQNQHQHVHQGPMSMIAQQPSYLYHHHPTPPYHSQAEVYPTYAKGPQSQQQYRQEQEQQQPHPSHPKYLATPSSAFHQPSSTSRSRPAPPHRQQQPEQHYQHQQQPQHLQSVAPLAINTKILAPVSSSAQSSPSSRKQQQHQSVAQLAEFAAHMVCYMLYGHQSTRRLSHNLCVGTPPSSMPSSPHPGDNSPPCPCEVCSRMTPYSTAPSTPLPSSAHSRAHQHQRLSSRPTHRRIMSESDIVQPKPVFRKFCLDVLSATLLSPSVVLLSLKYIQQLMINLKESNKIVNTGEGAEYRFFTGALILANKFLDDNTFTNKTWADITGMKIKDVNHLEMQFLNGIDFRLFTSSDHYSEWLANLTQFTSNYMPSQHQVAFQQQVAAAQSPISPMDYTSTPVEPNFGLMRQHGSALVGSQGSQTTAPVALSMASISHYIDSVKQIHQKTASTMRYQRVPASTMYSQQSQALVTLAAHPSQSQYMNLPASSKVQQASATGVYQGPTANCNSSPIPMSYTYQSGAPESVQRKRSANAAFEDAMDRSPCYESDSLSRTSQVPAMVPTHKRFSSASSVSALMGIGAGQDMVHGGPSPLIQQQRNHPQSTFSHRASVGSLPTSFRSQHQRSASGSYCVDMAGYSSSYGQEPTHLPMAMPNTFSRSGVVHPLDKEQDYYRPSSRMDVSYSGSHPMHVRTTSSAGCTQGYRPVTPPQCSPNKCEPSCQSMRCAPNSNNGSAYEVDPRLWGPLDSLSLYAITTQAAKRVVAQSKALSASANGLHMYYPTTLA